MKADCAMVRIWKFMAETGTDCARMIYQKQDAENATSPPTRNKQNVSRWYDTFKDKIIFLAILLSEDITRRCAALFLTH